MKRRMFVTGAIAASAAIRHVAARDLSTPLPNDLRLLEPVELADDLLLTDYRFLADNFKTNFLGEIEHVGDEAFDGQALVATFLDAAGAAIESIYPLPLIPVIQPGQRIPVYGTFREFNPLEDAWSEVTISICGEHPKLDYTEQLAQLDLHIEDLSENKEDDSYLAEGVIRNRSDADAQSVEVHAIYRDDGDRVVGFSRDWLDDPIPTGGEVAFSVGANLETLADPVLDPFAFIEGEYTVELVVCIGRPAGYAIEC